MRTKIHTCLLTVTLAILLAAAFGVGCSSASTEGNNDKDSIIQNDHSESEGADIDLSTLTPDLFEDKDDSTSDKKGHNEVTTMPGGTYEPITTELLMNVPMASAVPTPEPTVEMTEMYYVPGYVNETFVNLREEASTESNIIRVYAFGTELFVTGRNDEWFRVEIGENKGYMARAYVTLGYYETPTPTVRPTPVPTPASMYTVREGQFSEEEIALVAALIHAEGPGSTRIGYRAIASIVLNRVMNESDRFPDTVEGVLFQSGQFGYSKEYLESLTPNSTAQAAARYVFSTHGSTLPKKVLFYRAAYMGREWYDYTRYYATIEGNCYFYGIKYF